LVNLLIGSGTNEISRGGDILKTSKTFSVLIPARNEGANIGHLIDDILSQTLPDHLSLEKLIVVSDGSTDDTNDVVTRYSAKDERVELLVNARNLGKAPSLNLGMRQVDSEFLVLLDGDVRLNSPSTLRNLLEDIGGDVDMVGGNPVPADKGDSLAALVSRCGDIMRNDLMLRIRNGSNIYSAYGRILALSRRLYTSIELPVDQEGRTLIEAEDQFIYLSCIEQNLKYVFRGDAEVLFKLPTSFTDYLRQCVRFMFSADKTRSYFNDSRLSREYAIPFHVKVIAFANLCRREPLGALAWTGYRVIGRTEFLVRRYLLKRGYGAAWAVSESTKGSIDRP
jgi:glycosyltransferase involved in cell wall biosynthesis